jgi:UDP-glucose 4-epimerase
MKVLITGGAGFIGSHMADAFRAKGDEVAIFDNFSTGSLPNLDKFSGEVISGDIRDYEKIDPLIEKSDLIIHLAAALGVDKIMHDPIESMSVNVLGSEVVLKSAAKHSKRILIASTSEVYGKNPKQPLSEEDDRVIGTPQNIRWSYSDAKALEESMARALNLQQGLPVTTVRFFNTVGPKQTGQYGMVVPRFVKAALNGEDIVIFGDGSQTRVFCHVQDEIAAVLKLLETSKSVGEVYNIGGEGEVSIKELAETVIRVTGSKSKLTFKSYADAYPVGYEDMQRRVPNTAKVRNLTGWEPKHNLESIIKDVANFHSQSKE